jgi:hypothetical protein
MKEYRDYKRWWIDTQATNFIPSSYYGSTRIEAFEQHIKDLGLFCLMELLSEWEC